MPAMPLCLAPQKPEGRGLCTTPCRHRSHEQSAETGPTRRHWPLHHHCRIQRPVLLPRQPGEGRTTPSMPYRPGHYRPRTARGPQHRRTGSIPRHRVLALAGRPIAGGVGPEHAAAWLCEGVVLLRPGDLGPRATADGPLGQPVVDFDDVRVFRGGW